MDSHYSSFSLSGQDGQQSLDLRSWPSCVVPLIYGEVVLSPQCTNLCSPAALNSINYITLFYVWMFLRWTPFCLSVLVGLK